MMTTSDELKVFKQLNAHDMTSVPDPDLTVSRINWLPGSRSVKFGITDSDSDLDPDPDPYYFVKDFQKFQKF